MTLAPGTRLGPYEVRAPIGAGGMGEVYRARDTRPAMAREVAIKLVTTASTDESSLRRFEQEARATCAATHPNILAIYDVGVHDGRVYLVEELVEGVTLREALRNGALPVRRAAGIGQAVALGLAAAHAKGIVHRDIKPENVMLTRDGRVKILDFGLAKFHRDETAPSDDASTQTHATGPGTVLGTVSYMSPEQVRGLPLDHRSDIFSLGIVLYETLGGARPFSGETAPDTQAAILNSDPPDFSSALSVPPALDRLVRRCLEKQVDQRFQSASDLAFALSQPTSGAGRESLDPLVRKYADGAVRANRIRRAVPWAIAATAALAIAGLSNTRAPVPETVPETTYATLKAPDGFILGEWRTNDRRLPIRTPFTFVPNTRSLVVTASRESAKSQLFLRELGLPTARPVSGTDGAQVPFVSPDGRFIGFWAAGELKRLPLEGGIPTTICRVSVPPNGASWSVDDTIVFADQLSGRVLTVSARGGEARPLTEEPGAYRRHVTPFVLPDGKQVVYADVSTNDAADSKVVVRNINGGPPTLLLQNGTDARLLPTGQLAFMRLGSLMVVGFDRSKLSVVGEPTVALPNVMQSALRGITNGDHPGAGMFAVSSQGTLVFVHGPVLGSYKMSLNWVGIDGRAEPAEPVAGAPVGGRLFTRIAPDGNRAIVTVQSPLRRELWLMDWSRGLWTACQDCISDRGFAEWSPDGSRLLLGRDDALVTHRVDGTESDTVVVREPARKLVPGPWLASGRIVYQSRPSADLSQSEIKYADIGGGEGHVVVPAGVGTEPDVSPDGRWLAYGATMPGQIENVFVQAFPGPGSRMQISADGGANPKWSADGRTLYYLSASPGTRTLAVDMNEEGGQLKPGRPRQLREVTTQWCFGVRCYDMTAKNPRWLFRQPVGTEESVSEMNVVLNWGSTLPTIH